MRPLVLALLALAALPAPGELPRWSLDFDAAASEARDAEKDLLVDFTGSDWCVWCMRLDTEVFLAEGVREALAEQYVLVKVDLPRSPAALEHVPDIARNRQLSREYRVEAFPTVLLMTSAGEVYARTGYVEGGGPAYLAHLRELRRRGRPPLMAAIRLAGAFDSAPDEATRLPLVEEASARLLEAERGGAIARRLLPVASAALELDPENERGLCARALQACLTSGLASDLHLVRALELDPRNDLGLRERVLYAKLLRVRNEPEVRDWLTELTELEALGGVQDARLAREVYTQAARWASTVSRDPQRSAELARRALPLARGDAELVAELERLIAAAEAR